MPLNLNENNDLPEKEQGLPEPILHTPKRGVPVGKVIGIVASLLVAVAAIGYLVYIFSMNRSNKAPSQESMNQQPTQTAPVQSSPVPQSQPERTSEVSSKPASKGMYTIYIGSLADSQAAADEVGRWNQAGYKAAVIHANDHFRIALGQFSGLTQAKKEAGDLKEAFEYGYWIGMIE